jgi:cytochrome P450
LKGSQTLLIILEAFFLDYTDATVLVNYFGIHMSEETWGDPFNFRPERFLDQQGKFQANQNNLPFATGKVNI